MTAKTAKKKIYNLRTEQGRTDLCNDAHAMLANAKDSDNKYLSSAEIAERLGVNSQQIRRALNTLIGEGSISYTGVTSSTRYFYLKKRPKAAA